MRSVVLEGSVELPVRARAARVRSPARTRALRSLAVGALSISAWLALWQAASVGEWDVFFRFENIPAPTEVARAAVDLLANPKLLPHVWNSLQRIFIGYSIAALLAVLMGLAIGRLRLGAEALLPPLEVLRPIPAVAWIPLAILLFASPEHSMIFITFIGAFFPVLLSTVHGVEGIDRRLLNAALTLGASPLDIYVH